MNGHPVWGYFGFAIICLGVGTILITLGLGKQLPNEEDLEKRSGFVKTVVVIDSLSDKPTTLSTPLNEIHFTLKGQDTTFRYPSGWPGYGTLYDRLAFDVDIWVDPGDLSDDQPVTIYRLEQTMPEGWESAPISVSYQAIVDVQGRSYESYIKGGVSLLVASSVLLSIGLLVAMRNRRRIIPKAD